MGFDHLLLDDSHAELPTGSSKAGCVMPCLYGTLHMKDLLPLFEKSRAVIMVLGFSVIRELIVMWISKHDLVPG